MENAVEFICNGAQEFTPQVAVGLILFISALECLSNIAYAIASVGKTR
jgi:hypothetical protein